MSETELRAHLAKWVKSGRGDECFWESWPDCPDEEYLTPNMVLCVLDELNAEIKDLQSQVSHHKDPDTD